MKHRTLKTGRKEARGVATKLVISFPLLLLLLSLAMGCHQKASDPTTATTPPKLKIGYVLHGLNEFTQVIKQGAEDAARAEGVRVDVAGPASFSTTADAIALFEGMTQKKVDGLVVIPMPGEVCRPGKSYHSPLPRAC